MKKILALILLLTLLCVSVSAEEPADYGFDLDLNKVETDVFSGNKLTVVNVWGTFCGPCISEMPFLGTLASEYALDGVRFIGIVIDATADSSDAAARASAQSIIESTGANYLHLLVNEYLYYRFCAQSDYIPMSWFLDENGNPLNEEPIVGSMDYDTWKNNIEFYLRNR